MSTIHRSFKIRAYPTQAQRQCFARTEGACRFVRRKVLEEMDRYHEATGAYKTVVDMSRELTQWKTMEDMAWLKTIPSSPLTQELRDLDTAFKNFFAKRARYPKKKRKQTAGAIRFQLDQRQTSLFTAWAERTVKIPTIGRIKIAQPERLPRSLPKMITLSRDAAGRYFISFGVEVEVESLPLTGVAVGVDLGIKDLAVLSEGDKIPNAKALKGRERYLKRQQRALSRKVGSKQGEKKSKRYLKQQRRVAKIYARITDIRKDHAHKASIAIVRKADVIALEDLHVRGMVRNHRLAKAVSDSGFRMLRTQIEYKAGWYGREVLTCDRFAPTSKQCAGCGYIMNEMPLSVREWDCPQCGAHHDRDINAARNILNFALGAGCPEGAYPNARGGLNPRREAASAVSPMESDEARTHALSTPKVVPTKARMPRAA